jgi:hypothetical protein
MVPIAPLSVGSEALGLGVGAIVSEHVAVRHDTDGVAKQLAGSDDGVAATRLVGVGPVELAPLPRIWCKRGYEEETLVAYSERMAER